MKQDLQSFFDANRKVWDARVPIHRESDFYAMNDFLAGKNTLDAIVMEGIGAEVNGKSLLHLQCHFGQDTLCFARMGATVTGIDFSATAVQEARAIAQKIGVEATFVESNVYDLRDNLKGQFDIVFTSFGVTSWLPDLEEWAAIVAHFLKPGGIFYIAEFHPTLYLFDFDKQQIAFNYFNNHIAYSEDENGTYTDRYAEISGTTYFWQHSLAETIRPLLKNGLQLLDFQEFDFSPFNCFSNCKEVGKDKYAFGDFGVSLPHVFSLKMRKG